MQVTNRDGKPVKGLKQEQFTVTEDGKPQKISTFEYNDIEQVETAGKGDEAPITVPLGTVTSPEEIKAVVRDHRMIVMFFDLTSLQAEDLLRSTRAAQKYLQEQMTPADLVAVVAFGNTLKVVANFTNDRELLKQSVDALVPGHEAALSQLADAATAADGETAVTEDTGAAFIADDTEFNIFNTDRKLAAVEALCEVLEGIPGKKSIIQFTSGITQTGEENRSELIAATNSANRSNVSIYSVDSRGLLTATPGGDASTGASGGTAMFTGATVISQSQSRQDSRDTLATLAGDTGGRTFFDVGDFGKVFQSVQNDTSGYYLVGYYSTNAANDGAWRRVHVKVDQLPAGVHIRAREGYYAPKNFGVFTTEDRERQLEEAFQSETPEVELPLAVETAEFRLNANQVFVPISAKLAPSALQWAQKRGSRETAFDFAAEVRDAKSNRVVGALRDTITVKIGTEHFQDIQQHALVYQGGMILAPGEYKLKFLARENESGRIGTFEQNISLAPPQLDRLQVSSLLLSSQVEAVAEHGANQNAGARAGRQNEIVSAGRGRRANHSQRDARFHRRPNTVRFLPSLCAAKGRCEFPARGPGVFPQRAAPFRHADGCADGIRRKKPHRVLPPQPAARGSGRGPLHRAGHRRRCGNFILRIRAQLFCPSANGEARRFSCDSRSAQPFFA